MMAFHFIGWDLVKSYTLWSFEIESPGVVQQIQHEIPMQTMQCNANKIKDEHVFFLAQVWIWVGMQAPVHLQPTILEYLWLQITLEGFHDL